MKTKFTKGEWESVIDHSREAGNYPKTQITSNGKLIAECYKRNWDINKDEAEANAKLIAAAPALLSALINIMDFVVSSSCDSDGGLGAQKAYKDAEEAIKKATE